MKTKWFLLLVILVQGIFWASANGIESYTVEKSEMRITIDHFYRHQGLTPVVLSFGVLEISGAMDESGLVQDTADAARQGAAPPLLVVDLPGKLVTVGGEKSQAIVYEQNSVRTRLRLVKQDIPVILDLDWENKKGEFRFGGSRLTVTIQTEETSLGVFRIRLLNPAIMVMTTLLYLPSTGTIHRTGDPGSAVDPAACPIWARRLH